MLAGAGRRERRPMPNGKDTRERVLLATLVLTAVLRTSACQDNPTVDVSSCRLGAIYQADVTVPDDTRIEAGRRFTKTWRVRNTGSCSWGEGYSLTFVDGLRMGGPKSVAVPKTEPGENANISVDLAAPTEEGRYRSYWQICVNETQCFGDKMFLQIIVVSAPPTIAASPTMTVAQTPATKPAPTSDGTGGDTAIYEGLKVQVPKVDYSRQIGSHSAEDGFVFVSLYIIGTNTGESNKPFNAMNFRLIDANGETYERLLNASRDPGFSFRQVEPGETYEGWWTTRIPNRRHVKDSLQLQWQPDWPFSPVFELSVP